MNDRKQKLLDALDAFVNQRPGIDPRDYGGGIEGWRAYRRESAAVTKDLHDYLAIRSQIHWRDSITADDIIKAAESAFSGRLTINDISAHYDDNSTYWNYSISYCAGQYMPTEYRKAACAVLAAAWWKDTREDCPVEYDSGQSFENSPGGWMHKQAKQTFSRSVQQGYFR